VLLPRGFSPSGVLLALLVGAIACAVVAGPTTAGDQGSCSRAAAVQVATQLRIGVDSTTGKTPINQVLCGPFFGSRSQGMVAAIAIPSCGASVGWMVFRFEAGAWQLVLRVNHGAFLSVVGTDVQEKIGILRRGDAHCFPSAYKTRIWHWNGTRLTASAWKVTQANHTTRGKLVIGYFKTPSANIECDYAYGGTAETYVRCGIKSGL
jgi:hypothetical protein